MSSQYGNRNSVREQFEQMLKESNYFADVINTHRRATAEVMADVIGLMMDSGGLDQAKVLAALKSMGDGTTPGKPSLGSAKRLVAVLVMDAIQARNSGK